MLPIFFAPLQGYTDAIYRLCHAKHIGGVATYYSPFVRLEKGEIRKKDLWDISPENNGCNFVPQIIFNGVEEFNLLVDTLTKLGYKEIDLNMGCPFPMQTKHGRGAGILPNTNTVRQIAHKLNEWREKSGVVFSMKMRLGLENPTDALDLLPILNETQLKHITLHPRVGKQQYKGALNCTAFDKFYAQCTHPICFNGDILSTEDIAQLKSRYPKLCGVMIGRGLLARPTLAREYNENREWAKEQRCEAIFAMHKELLQTSQHLLSDDMQIINRIHAFWEYQKDILPQKSYKQIMKCRTTKEYSIF